MRIPYLSRFLFNSRKYKQGISYYNKGQYNEAIGCFECVFNDNRPRKSLYEQLSFFFCIRARYNLGVLYFAMGNYPEGASLFESVSHAMPEKSDLFEYLGICYNNMQKFDHAVDAFKKVMLLEPDHLFPKFKLGIAFHNLGMWNKSIEICQEILKNFPNYANVHFYLGLSYIGRGDYHEATEAFKNALNINPFYKDARLRLAMTLAYLDNIYDAFFHLSALIEEFPKYPDIYYYLGIFCSVSKNYEEAITFFNKALHLNPAFTEAGIKCSLLNYESGKRDSALEILEKISHYHQDDKHIKIIIDYITKHQKDSDVIHEWIADEKDVIAQGIEKFIRNIEIKPSFSEMLSILKSFPTENGLLYENLIPLVSASIKTTPDYPDNYCSLGALYFKVDNLEGARKAFEKALEINPHYVQARIHLLKTMERQNDFQSAVEHGNILLNQGITYPDFLFTLGKLYMGLHMTEEAEKVFKKVLDQHPSYVEARFYLGKTYKQHNKREEARQVFQECLASNPPRKLREEILRIIKTLGS